MASKIIKAHGISSCIIRQTKLPPVDVVAGTMSSLELLVVASLETLHCVSRGDGNS